MTPETDGLGDDLRGTARGWLYALALGAFLAWFQWFAFYGFKELIGVKP